MFQSHLLFQDYSYYSSPGERNKCPIGLFSPNSPALPEGEGVTATSLGQRRSGGGKYIILRVLKLIRRVPSVEGATATSLGNFKLARGKFGCKEIFEKTLQMGYLIVVTTPTRRVAHGA